MSCSATAQIFVGDVGTVFKLTVKDENGDIVDLSAASSLQIKFKKPYANSAIVKTGVLDTDGTDGVMKYVAVNGDLDVAGTWNIQGHVIIGTLSLSTNISTFEVLATL